MPHTRLRNHSLQPLTTRKDRDSSTTANLQTYRSALLTRELQTSSTAEIFNKKLAGSPRPLAMLTGHPGRGHRVCTTTRCERSNPTVGSFPRLIFSQLWSAFFLILETNGLHGELWTGELFICLTCVSLFVFSSLETISPSSDTAQLCQWRGLPGPFTPGLWINFFAIFIIDCSKSSLIDAFFFWHRTKSL